MAIQSDTAPLGFINHQNEVIVSRVVVSSNSLFVQTGPLKNEVWYFVQSAILTDP